MPERASAGWERGMITLFAAMLLACVAVRVPGFASPPLDGHHIRQSDTASIARIMARDGVSLWTPRIGWAGSPPGPVESELPLYAAGVAIGWQVLNATDGHLTAWPRALSLLAWLLGGVALARLAQRRLPDVPTPALVLLYGLSPLAIQFSRAIQPDAWAVALLLFACERADAAGRAREGTPAVLLAGLLLGLAIATKGTIAAFLPLLPWLTRTRGLGVPRAGVLAAVGLAIVIPTVWYIHAHFDLGREGASFGLWGAESGKWTTTSTAALPTLASILRAAFVQTLTPLGAALLVPGLLALRRRPEATPFALALALGAASAALLLEGFATHDYYQLPWVPFASVVVGLGLHEVARAVTSRRRALAATGAVSAVLLAGSVLLAQAQLRAAGRQDTRIAGIAAAVRHVLPEDLPTIVVDAHSQSLIYALDRQGWHRATLEPEDLDHLEAMGAHALLVTDRSSTYRADHLWSSMDAGRRLVAEGEGWALFALAPPRRLLLRRLRAR